LGGQDQNRTDVRFPYHFIRIQSSRVWRSTSQGLRMHVAIILRVRPERVALDQRYTVILRSAPSREQVTFMLRRPSAGGTGSALGQYPSNEDGVVRFHPQPFTRLQDMGRWIVTASFKLDAGFHVLGTTHLIVVGLLLRSHSQLVQQGKAYRFHLYTHCGANFSVDFDHAFWDLTDPAWADQPGGLGPHEGLGNPFQWGTMTLVDSSHARFDFVPSVGTGTATAPSSLRFSRHVGPKIVAGFCD
jgi:hypothetical protein